MLSTCGTFRLNKPILHTSQRVCEIRVTEVDGLKREGQVEVARNGAGSDVIHFVTRYEGNQRGWRFLLLEVVNSGGHELREPQELNDTLVATAVRAEVADYLSSENPVILSSVVQTPPSHSPTPAVTTAAQVPAQPPYEGAVWALIDEIVPFQPGEGISGQPRTDFDEVQLKMLADSIREHGQTEPIVVSRNDTIPVKKYEIRSGERRWRAAKDAGKTGVWIAIAPAMPKKEQHLAALIENLFRSGHNDVELARALQVQIEAGNMNVASIARLKGTARQTIINLLSLLKLHPDLIKCLDRRTPRERRINKSIGQLLSVVPVSEQIGIWDQARTEPTKGLARRKLQVLCEQFTMGSRKLKKYPSDKAREVVRRIVRLEQTVAELGSFTDTELGVYGEYEGAPRLASHDAKLGRIIEEITALRGRIAKAKPAA